MKITFIDTSYPLNNRNDKLIESFQKKYIECEIHAITWNRERLHINKTNYQIHSYEKQSELGNNFDKLRKMIGFFRFVKQVLNDINPDIIVASHWDSLIAGAMFKGKAKKLVYENLDIPTGNKWIRYCIKKIENLCLKKTDIIIHASRFFKELYPQKIPQYILENKPTLFTSEDFTPLVIHTPLRVSFIGSLRYPEVFYNLIDAVKGDSRILLNLHGAGSHFEKIAKYSEDIPNIKMTGRYNYNDIKHFYDESDLIWAVYPGKDYNVKYAISNKFHESMMLRRPCIFCSGTKLGDFVSKNKIGFSVNPYDINAIKGLFNDILNNPNIIKETVNFISEFVSLEKTWDEDFDQIEFI